MYYLKKYKLKKIPSNICWWWVKRYRSL